MEEDIKNINSGADNFRKPVKIYPVVDLSRIGKGVGDLENTVAENSFEKKEEFQPSNLKDISENSRWNKIKIATFIAVPLAVIIIGSYFTLKEITRSDSPEVFSKDEVKAGIKDYFPGSQSSQKAQTSQSNQQQQQQQAAQNQPVSALSPSKEEPADLPDAAKEEEKTFSFAILGDTQYFKAANSEGNFQKAVKAIKKLSPDKVISIGDLVGCDKKDCEEKFNSWKTALGDLSSKFYAVIGNHDGLKNDSDSIWQKVFDFPTNGPEGFSELAYSFDYENSHFVVLDSEKPEEHIVNSTQRDWLEKDLSGNTKENTFVFFHEPAYPVSSKIGESLDAKSKERDALWKILDAHNVTAVFSGHEHLNSRRKINSSVFSDAKNNIYQFIIGNTDSFDHEEPKAGVAEYFHKGAGFMLISAKGKSITAKVYSVDGAELNSFDFNH